MSKITLYAHWYSSCAWRVRIALEYKQIEYDYISIDLIEGEQRKTEYKKINPMNQVPALLVNDFTITQSDFPSSPQSLPP